MSNKIIFPGFELDDRSNQYIDKGIIILQKRTNNEAGSVKNRKRLGINSTPINRKKIVFCLT